MYEFDAATERVRFGNGVNGRIPPQGATMLATYAVSDGDQGNVAANRKWQVAGFRRLVRRERRCGGRRRRTDRLDR